MSARVSSSILIGALTFSICGAAAIRATAQAALPQQHEAQSPPAGGDPAQQHDMQHMQGGPGHGDAADTRRIRHVWLPGTPMPCTAGRQMDAVAHGNVFLQYLHDGGDRGGEQAGSIAGS